MTVGWYTFIDVQGITLQIATISPSDQDYDQTMSTLRYGRLLTLNASTFIMMLIMMKIQTTSSTPFPWNIA